MRPIGPAMSALRRGLPQAAQSWLAGDDIDHPPDVVISAGFFAEIGLALNEAYSRTGEELRDLIWALHRFLKDSSAPAPTALEPYAAWHRLWIGVEDQWRRAVIHNWIDAANERLTMQAYHRADQRRRHALALIAGPMAMLGVCPRESAADPRGEVACLAELVLRFFDLLDAERQAAIGRNRIAAPRADGFGGFYALAAEARPPSAEDIVAAALALADDIERFDPAGQVGYLQPLAARARGYEGGAARKD